MKQYCIEFFGIGVSYLQKTERVSIELVVPCELTALKNTFL